MIRKDIESLKKEIAELKKMVIDLQLKLSTLQINHYHYEQPFIPSFIPLPSPQPSIYPNPNFPTCIQTLGDLYSRMGL
jgi:hypothetical protein